MSAVPSLPTAFESLAGVCKFIAVPQMNPAFHAKHRHPVEFAGAFLRLVANSYPALEQAFRKALPLQLVEGALAINHAFSVLALSEEKLHWFDVQMTEVLKVLVPVVRDPELPSWLSECRWAVGGAFDSGFSISSSQKMDAADALTCQTVGGQSVLYRLFRETIDCEHAAIRRIELTYLAAAITTFVYLRYGQEIGREEVLDDFTYNILNKSIPSSGEMVSLEAVVQEYQGRFAEYNAMLPSLFNPSGSTSGNPSATLLMHAYECVTRSSARERMIHIVAASGLIELFFFEHVDFVKKMNTAKFLS
jgi:hypothetical protein